ncbi:MAG: ferrous iron transport protein B, partial [Candidatus Methanomethylicota archaeon]
LYAFDIVMVILLGRFLTKNLPGEPVGLIMEMPDYRAPMLRTVIMKTWVRTKDFIYVALPLIVIGSVFLEFFKVTGFIWTFASFASPIISGLLGLPAESAIPLIFGILRKELTLIMLIEVFGTENLGSVLSGSQMIVFSLVSMIYVPCIATIAALVKEFGWKRALIISAVSVGLALLIGGVANIFLHVAGF